jgi:hypothetical protein
VIAAVVPVPAPAQVGQHDRLITGLQLFAGASAQGRRLRITHTSVIRVHDARAWAEACCVVRVCALEVSDTGGNTASALEPVTELAHYVVEDLVGVLPAHRQRQRSVCSPDDRRA